MEGVAGQRTGVVVQAHTTTSARKARRTLLEMLEIVPGPDFPTAGFILGRKGIHDAYTTGRGIVRMQARTRIREAEKKKRAAIIVSELPYQVNKARLVEQIANLVQSKRLEGIADLRDESDRDGIRVVIELKRDAVPEVVQTLFHAWLIHESVTRAAGAPPAPTYGQALLPVPVRASAT